MDDDDGGDVCVLLDANIINHECVDVLRALTLTTSCRSKPGEKMDGADVVAGHRRRIKIFKS